MSQALADERSNTACGADTTEAGTEQARIPRVHRYTVFSTLHRETETLARDLLPRIATLPVASSDCAASDAAPRSACLCRKLRRCKSRNPNSARNCEKSLSEPPITQSRTLNTSSGFARRTDQSPMSVMSVKPGIQKECRTFASSENVAKKKG